jgi:hypothetical protein
VKSQYPHPEGAAFKKLHKRRAEVRHYFIEKSFNQFYFAKSLLYGRSRRIYLHHFDQIIP